MRVGVRLGMDVGCLV